MRKIFIILGLAAVAYMHHYADSAVTSENDCQECPYSYIYEDDDWTLISDDTVATVYNAVPSQCNSDCSHTASMYTLNMDDVLSDRVIAMERTMMTEYGISYGDIVLIEGTDVWDGVWQVQDTMNRRFAGKHKIDILVPDGIRRGKWDNVKIYIPTNGKTEEQARITYNI